jgi:hypothetical protein
MIRVAKTEAAGGVPAASLMSRTAGLATTQACSLFKNTTSCQRDQPPRQPYAIA